MEEVAYCSRVARVVTCAKAVSHVIYFNISPLPRYDINQLLPSHPMPTTTSRSLRPNLFLRNTTRRLSLPSRPRRPPPSKPTAPPPRTPLTSFSVLVFFASWFPVWSFVTNNVFCIMSVTGPSMSPFLNTDHDSSTVSDRVWVNMWRAGEGLERGMVVAYRYIYPPLLAQ